jgi:DNA (cytosine-5)-methyltransferase 1
MPARLYNLKEAAILIGIAPITLKRWLLSGKVQEVARDRNGWRVFTEEDIARIRRFATHVDPPRT